MVLRERESFSPRKTGRCLPKPHLSLSLSYTGCSRDLNSRIPASHSPFFCVAAACTGNLRNVWVSFLWSTCWHGGRALRGCILKNTARRSSTGWLQGEASGRGNSIFLWRLIWRIFFKMVCPRNQKKMWKIFSWNQTPICKRSDLCASIGSKWDLVWNGGWTGNKTRCDTETKAGRWRSESVKDSKLKCEDT